MARKPRLKSTDKDDTVWLYQFAPRFGLPNASPFCLKLETYLRMAALEYGIVDTEDPRKSPKGKLPFIEHRGKYIADSRFIIGYLNSEYFVDLDRRLNEWQRAESYNIIRMLEDSLYWVMLYSRWVDDDNWPTVRQAFFGKMPPVLNRVIPAMIRKKMKRDMDGQGILRHDKEEVYELGKQDIAALSTILGSRTYIMGDEPTLADASFFGFMANILWCPIDNPLKEEAQQCKQFERYLERMRKQYFPEMVHPDERGKAD